jgi:Flp pilus assembly protein TadD
MKHFVQNRSDTFCRPGGTAAFERVKKSGVDWIRAAGVFPHPACGERVGVSGLSEVAQRSAVGRHALAPHPESAPRRADSDPPQVGRGGWGRCPRIVLLLISLVCATAAAAAEPAGSPTRPVGPRNAEADAATYDRCLKLAKQNPGAAQSLAQTWHERGGAHPAEHCAAVALVGLRRYKEAATRLEALGEAMTTAPAGLRADVFDQAGQAWLLAGDPVRAYAAAGQALGLQPNDPELLLDRAEAAASAGYYDKAVADLDHVLKADPGRVEALIYRASANRTLNRLDAALADVEKALTLTPNSVPALLERGNIRRLRGDLEGARTDWERVGQLAPGGQADMAAKANIEHLETTGDTTPEKARRRP